MRIFLNLLPPIVIVFWIVLGQPLVTIAQWIWPNGPAPWEAVTAVYYPGKNLMIDKQKSGLATLDDCRRWVRAAAAADGDPSFENSDYECGVGFIESRAAGIAVYRLTLR